MNLFYIVVFSVDSLFLKISSINAEGLYYPLSVVVFGVGDSGTCC